MTWPTMDQTAAERAKAVRASSQAVGSGKSSANHLWKTGGKSGSVSAR